jgi:hypothetical protein
MLMYNLHLAELGPIDPKAQPSKRRSFFRNAGTASSPDLAHLVNKGIQSRQYERPHAIPEPTRPENGRLANSSKGNSATDTDTSEYLTSPLRLGPPLEANGSYEHRNSLRDRSTSHGLPARTPSSNASTVSRQTGASTILQASGTNSSNTGTISGRSMISSDDGTRASWPGDHPEILADSVDRHSEHKESDSRDIRQILQFEPRRTSPTLSICGFGCATATYCK